MTKPTDEALKAIRSALTADPDPPEYIAKKYSAAVALVDELRKSLTPHGEPDNTPSEFGTASTSDLSKALGFSDEEAEGHERGVNAILRRGEMKVVAHGERGEELPDRKPTIAELEAILGSGKELEIYYLPNGEIRTRVISAAPSGEPVDVASLAYEINKAIFPPHKGIYGGHRHNLITKALKELPFLGYRVTKTGSER